MKKPENLPEFEVMGKSRRLDHKGANCHGNARQGDLTPGIPSWETGVPPCLSGPGKTGLRVPFTR